MNKRVFSARRLRWFIPAVLGLLSWFIAPSALAQAPGLVWSVNVGAGAEIFSVDSQTNLYVNRTGTVVTINRAGIPIQTNLICPVTSPFAQRDAAGNFYFA